jgi:hypothetical protein
MIIALFKAPGHSLAGLLSEGKRMDSTYFIQNMEKSSSVFASNMPACLWPAKALPKSLKCPRKQDWQLRTARHGYQRIDLLNSASEWDEITWCQIPAMDRMIHPREAATF